MGLAVALLSVMGFILILMGIALLFAVVAVVLFIISFSTKKKGKESYKALRILSAIFMVPTILMTIFMSCVYISDSNAKNKLLSCQLLNDNLTRSEKIIAQGASVDCGFYSNDEVEPGNHTLLYALCKKDYLYPGYVDAHVTDENRDEMIRFLLENGANPNREIYYHEKDYKSHSFTKEADINNSSDTCGATPFLMAIYCNNLSSARLLLEYGADINAKDYSGFNAAYYAMRNKSKEEADEILDFLSENGCELNVVNNYGKSNAEIYYDMFGRRFDSR